MTRLEICILGLLVPLTAGRASADDRVDLRVRSLPAPAPTSLDIRRGPSRAAELRTAQTDADSPASDGEDEDQGNPFELRERLRGQLRESDLVGQQRKLNDKVVFRFNLGFGLDDGKPAVDGSLLATGQSLESAGYERLRTYTFGDLVVGTRGLVLESASAYFAANFRINNTDPLSSAIPSVHDQDGSEFIQIRSAYGEAEGDKYFDNKWLKPISFKAGRMFEYGAGVVHYDGVSAVYDVGPLLLSAWVGRRVSNWTFQSPTGLVAPPNNQLVGSQGAVNGTGVVLDLYRWKKWPLVVFASGISFDETNFGEQGLAYQYNRDISLRASLRNINRNAARQTLTLRARVSQVTILFAEIDNRAESDWIYDMLVRRDDFEREVDPRDYLNLGPPLPRTLARVRAGTVLFDAIDVLLSGAIAVEHANSDVANSAFSSSFFEAGGAFDLRIRRAIRVGGSFETRIYRRDKSTIAEPDNEMPGDLPLATGSFGERGYIQGGGRIQYSTGARGFTSNAELYGRLYDHQSPYFERDELDNEARVGGRFSIQAHVGDRLLLKAIYDVSGSLEFAPEITGIKSLRVMIEGTF